MSKIIQGEERKISGVSERESQKLKLLLICPKRGPGVVTALKNLKSVVGADFRFMEDIIYYLPVFKNNFVRRGYFKLQKTIKLLNLHTLKEFGDNIIFGGWGFPYNILTDKLNKIGIRPSVMWCSTLGQAEMTPTEIPRFAELLRYLKKRRIKCLLLHRRLFESYGYIKNAIFLPHTIDPSRIKPTNKKELNGLNVDLFCPLRYGKNILTQILACRLSKINFTLHVNFDYPELREILTSLELKVTFHPWMEEQEYWSFIGGMDVSLQVTHTESFNYAVAERMCLGIPVLTTYNIYLVAEDPFLSQYLCVDAPDTPWIITEKLDVLIRNKSLRVEIGAQCKERIQSVAKKNNQEASQKIKELFRE